MLVVAMILNVGIVAGTYWLYAAPQEFRLPILAGLLFAEMTVGVLIAHTFRESKNKKP